MLENEFPKTLKTVSFVMEKLMFLTCSLMNGFHRFWVTFRDHFGTKMVPKSVTGALLEVTWASKALPKGFKKQVQKKE